jgi:hypothetical protein
VSGLQIINGDDPPKTTSAVHCTSDRVGASILTEGADHGYHPRANRVSTAISISVSRVRRDVCSFFLHRHHKSRTVFLDCVFAHVTGFVTFTHFEALTLQEISARRETIDRIVAIHLSTQRTTRDHRSNQASPKECLNSDSVTYEIFVRKLVILLTSIIVMLLVLLRSFFSNDARFLIASAYCDASTCALAWPGWDTPANQVRAAF